MSPATTSGRIDLSGLEFQKEYAIQIEATNGAGTTVSDQVFRIETDEDILPPVIVKTVPGRDEFFVGFTVDLTDYLYEIEYGTDRDELTSSFVFSQRGVTQVADLISDTIYYYRLRRLSAWGLPSAWTMTNSVSTRDQEGLPATARLEVIRADGGAYVFFDPVDQAVGYQIDISQNGDQKTVTTSKARPGAVFVGGVAAQAPVTFVVAAIDSRGTLGERSLLELGN